MLNHRGRSPIAERALIQARLDRAAQLLADGVSARGALAVPGLAQWEVELLTSALDRAEKQLLREFGWDARGVGMYADAWEVFMP